MKKKYKLTSISVLLAFAATNAAFAQTSMSIDTPSTTEDWATSTLWDNGVPTSADDASVTSDSTNQGVLEINSGTNAAANKVDVLDNATLKINSGSLLTIAKFVQDPSPEGSGNLILGTNGKAILDGGTLSSAAVDVNNGSFIATAGSTITSKFNLGANGNLSVTGSTVYSSGGNFFSRGVGGNLGDVATSTYDSSTINIGAGHGTTFFFDGGNGKKVLNFNNGTTLNAYSAINGDGFVTSSSNNVRVSWDGTTYVDLEVNVTGGSKLLVGTMNLVDGNGAGLTGGNSVFNIQGSSSTAISTISTTAINLGLSNVAGSTFSNSINLKGYSELKSNGNIHIGTNNAAKGGTASINIEGTGNRLETNGQIRLGRPTVSTALSDGATGGTSSLIVNGYGNIVKTTRLDMGSKGQDGHDSLVSIIGANTLSVSGRTVVGWGDEISSGTNKIYLKGVDASNKMIFEQDDTLDIWNSFQAASTGVNEVKLDGAVKMSRSNGVGSSINIATQSAQKGGIGRFIVSGADNEVELNNVKIGHSSQTGGQAIFRVEGTGSSININGTLSVIGGSGTSLINQVGGVLEFALTDAGVSSIFAENVDVFSGILLVDFTDMVAAYEAGQRFDLLTSANSLEAYYEALVASGRFGANLRDGDATDAAVLGLSMDGKTIFVTYTSAIPEPGTYAAIFGALALAFAVYRRRN